MCSEIISKIYPDCFDAQFQIQFSVSPDNNPDKISACRIQIEQQVQNVKSHLNLVFSMS